MHSKPTLYLALLIAVTEYERLPCFTTSTLCSRPCIDICSTYPQAFDLYAYAF